MRASRRRSTTRRLAKTGSARPATIRQASTAASRRRPVRCRQPPVPQLRPGTRNAGRHPIDRPRRHPAHGPAAARILGFVGPRRFSASPLPRLQPPATSAGTPDTSPRLAPACLLHPLKGKPDPPSAHEHSTLFRDGCLRRTPAGFRQRRPTLRPQRISVRVTGGGRVAREGRRSSGRTLARQAAPGSKRPRQHATICRSSSTPIQAITLDHSWIQTYDATPR